MTHHRQFVIEKADALLAYLNAFPGHANEALAPESKLRKYVKIESVGKFLNHDSAFATQFHKPSAKGGFMELIEEYHEARLARPTPQQRSLPQSTDSLTVKFTPMKFSAAIARVFAVDYGEALCTEAASILKVLTEEN